MEHEIVNRVANSALVTIDLEDFYPEGNRVNLDIAPWLTEGIVLQEKVFRNYLKTWDTNAYQNCFVALFCSSDAILPGWAYTLVSIQLQGIAKKVVIGTQETLETILYSELIASWDVSSYKDKSVIIKGCANKPIPENAYVLLAEKLYPVAKSIMFGEACSSVPLYKKSK